ncbi:DUF4369 domain-containing protein [Urechidicola croceus]|uniref:DUF4369 domain-containing protein n=1 Tax=Urechidicola croceus TaxID=1850246 RepID=A0A1D8P5V2_9FLAO|nr:DUF4369 domain-containing protein [Urechidicola croceus]AOW19953.1 hypothetical protein LPB138_04305 [Urechidicola croceus]
MLRKVITFAILLFIVSSCVKDQKKITSPQNYVLSVSIKNANGSKSYLHKLSTKPALLVDSAITINNKIVFKGKVDFPERYLLTVENVFGGKMFILDNDTIKINIPNDNLVSATINGSALNDELVKVQENSEKIYNQIDLLFPDLQRARLENNAVKLALISKKMSAIEKQNIEFYFNYAKQNSDSFISAMILNDLSKRDSINFEKVKETYNSLSERVKQSTDSKQIELFLNSVH